MTTKANENSQKKKKAMVFKRINNTLFLTIFFCKYLWFGLKTN